MKQSYRTELHRILMESFDLEELRTLTFDLGVDYDSLVGEGKAGKVREMILYLSRQDQLGHLLAEMQRLRTDRLLGERYVSEATLWNQISNFTAADFSDITSVILDTIRYAIGTEPTGLHDEYGRLVLYGLDVSPAVKNLRLPALLPVVFLRGAQLTVSDIQDVVHLLTIRRGINTRVFLLVVTFDNEVLRNAKDLVYEQLRPYGYDAIVVTREQLSRIVFGDDPKASLRKLILSGVSLQTIAPFVITGPTPDHMFFGRELELRYIAERIRESSYAVVGGRRIGKSSLLIRLHRVRLPMYGLCTLYYDCSFTTTYESFLEADISNEWSRPFPDGPTTLGDLLYSSFNDKTLVLLLDEADKLVSVDSAQNWQIFNALRALVNSGRAQVVLSGERALRNALRDPKSPLFNFANEMFLGPLSFRAVKELVTRPMKQLEIELMDEKAILDRIWAFTSGHPNVVQRFCHRLIERLNELGTRHITLYDVDAIIEDPSFQRDDFLRTYWEGATPLEKIISLLMTDNDDIRTLQSTRQALAERCNLHPKAREMDEALQRLVDLRSILKRTPAGYEFAIEAFPLVVAGTMTLTDMLEILTEEYQEQHLKGEM
jgi:hypothetical protein